MLEIQPRTRQIYDGLECILIYKGKEISPTILLHRPLHASSDFEQAINAIKAIHNYLVCARETVPWHTRIYSCHLVDRGDKPYCVSPQACEQSIQFDQTNHVITWKMLSMMAEEASL